MSCQSAQANDLERAPRHGQETNKTNEVGRIGRRVARAQRARSDGTECGDRKSGTRAFDAAAATTAGGSAWRSNGRVGDCRREAAKNARVSDVHQCGDEVVSRNLLGIGKDRATLWAAAAGASSRRSLSERSRPNRT